MPRTDAAKTEPCPHCPRRMMIGRPACSACVIAIRLYGRPSPSRNLVQCPTCPGRMQQGKGDVCSKCSVVKTTKGLGGKKPKKAEYDGPRYTTKGGVEIDKLAPTHDEEKAARAGRVEAYAAMVGDDGQGIINYQAGIRVAVGA